MNFELNDVASSSSSSSPSQSDQEDDSSDQEVDENLAYELRSALHLAVGKICRAEDKAAMDAESSPAFTMSKDAIVALTDLAYHYSTSLLANDLVAFSKHAKRQTVKTDDVLLMARKDKKGMLAELKRVMDENPDVYTEGTKKPKARLKSSVAAAARKKVSAKISKRSNSKSKDTTKKGKQSIGSSSSSSSSSSDDDSHGDDALKIRRRKLELERKNLHKSAFRSGNAKDDRLDLDNLIANNDSFDNSSSGIEFEFGASKKKKAANRKKPNRKGAPKSVGDLTDSDDQIDHDEKNKKSEAPQGNNMVIDLASD
mmetsp:Transcript_1546/g.3296  ORF Transcript_1546/g.3296 Transcript_1546/m.3296 type:complete len:313 (-) Transcript_1546:412-1350(-)